MGKRIILILLAIVIVCHCAIHVAVPQNYYKRPIGVDNPGSSMKCPQTMDLGIKVVIQMYFWGAFPVPDEVVSILPSRTTAGVVWYKESYTIEGYVFIYNSFLVDVICDNEGKWWITFPGLADILHNYYVSVMHNRKW